MSWGRGNNAIGILSGGIMSVEVVYRRIMPKGGMSFYPYDPFMVKCIFVDITFPIL